MSTSFSGSLPLLSTLFVFYYTDFMANKICMYVCMYVWVHKWTLADKTRSLVYKNFLVYFHAKAVKLVSAFHHRRFHLNYLNSFGDFDRFRSGIARFLWQRVFIPRKKTSDLPQFHICSWPWLWFEPVASPGFCARRGTTCEFTKSGRNHRNTT